MRHGKKFNHLGRKAGHRKALLKNMAIALIEHKRIVTTVAKAKALRVFIEPLITKAKTNTTHSRRVVFSYLQNKDALKELFGPINDKVGSRPGGYCRIIKTGFRKSDGAEMAMIELVDFNEIYTNKKRSKDTGTSKKRRTRRGGKRGGGKTAAAAATEAATEVAEELAEEADGAGEEE
ncbi:MAG: 50S ribosomal protein L17 [Bacteroidota bacterium]